jgi:hypothetical protein
MEVNVGERISITLLFVIAKNGMLLKFLTVEVKVWCISLAEYCAAIKIHAWQSI